MSFLIDPPLLYLSGLAIFFLGTKAQWSRQAKIVIGLAISLVFIAFSTLLYADIIRCTFPLFSGMKGSEFMFHTNITHIHSSDVPEIIVLFLFMLYPVWIFAGYATALLYQKRKRVRRDVYSYERVKRRPRDGSSVYSVSRGTDPKRCVREAVDAIGGISRFVKRGDKVLIKVNICGGVPGNMGSYTSTDVAGAVVELVRSAGAEPTVADADMIWTKFWQAARDSGWAEWAKENGVKLVNLSETDIVRFNFGENSALSTERVSLDTVEADVIISVPTMKTHLLTGVTLGMKNMYGTFPEVDKARYHKKKIEETIYEVNRAFTPSLTIIDGSIGGEAIGPLSCQPVGFQTIVASNDVVTADSIASQLIGYDPMEITHIRIAHERGLGDASGKFDLASLPYPHTGGKDGNWDRPKREIKDFYEWGIELLLNIPGWDTLFNIGADFFLYDLARLPVLKYLTPSLLQLLHDAIYMTIKEMVDTDADRARRRNNIILMLIVSIAAIVTFSAEGYIWRASLTFELSFLIAIAVSIVAAARMKTVHLIALLLSSGLVSAVIEQSNTSSGLLTYAGSYGVSPFIVFGWMIMMTVILQVADILAPWITGLGIFLKVRTWSNLPFGAAIIVTGLFMYWEGYFSAAGAGVLMIYAGMVIVGLVYSTRHSIEWNMSLLAAGVITGGYMELIGSLAGFWDYRFEEALSVFFALSWAVNAWAVHGLPYLIGIDLGDRLERGLARREDPSARQ